MFFFLHPDTLPCSLYLYTELAPKFKYFLPKIYYKNDYTENVFHLSRLFLHEVSDIESTAADKPTGRLI